MARLIDADALKAVRFHGYPEIEITPSDVNAEAYKRGWNDAIDAIIESAPTIEIVRCKDCIHGFASGRCVKNLWIQEPNGFCSRGEGRDDGKVD